MAAASKRRRVRASRTPGPAGHVPRWSSRLRRSERVSRVTLGSMSLRPPPATACWQHRGARSGFEVAYFVAREHGWRVDGTTAAIEDAQTWVVTYRIEADAAWATRSARIEARTATGRRETLLESDGAGHWLVDGGPAPYLDGCMDVDLESSAMTNTLPVHRLDLQPWRPGRCARRLRPRAHPDRWPTRPGSTGGSPTRRRTGDTTTPLPLSASGPVSSTTTAAWWSTIPASRSGPGDPESRPQPARSGS